jgi:Zn-finger nucleic acid-binding protein
MNCAACGEPLIVVEHENIELDYCANCFGVWFDSGEVELLMDTMGLESTGLEALHLAPEAKSDEKKRRCPECQRRMKKVRLGHEPELVIDICPDGEGLWFDSGEVGELVSHLAAQQPGEENSQERVIEFLGEVIKVRS